MASFPARIIDELILRPLEQLLSNPETVRLHLDTGTRHLLERVELVTDLPYNLTLPIPPGATQLEFRNMPGCTVEYVEYYGQNGIPIRERFWHVICPGDTVTVPLIVSAT